MASPETPDTRDLRWERRELRLGIVAAVFFILAVVLAGPIDLTSMDGDEVVAHFEDNKNIMFAAFGAVGVAAFCLLWFFGAARARLGRGGAGAGRLATTGFGAGGAFVALLLAGKAAAGAPSAIYNFGFEGAELDPVVASVLNYLAYDLWALAGIAASVSILAFATAGKMTGILSLWLVRGGYVVAVIAFLSFVFPYLTLAIAMLWFASVSVGMGRTSRD